MSDTKCFCIDREKELEERITELEKALLAAVNDIEKWGNSFAGGLPMQNNLKKYRAIAEK